jgi:putative methionine-R-sulfoxide reductase with GAF domain
MHPIVLFTLIIIFMILPMLLTIIRVIFKSSIIFNISVVFLVIQAITVILAYGIGYTRNLNHLLWGFPIGVGLTAYGYVFLNKTIRIKLQDLIRGIADISKGKVDHKIEQKLLQRNDEIGELAKSTSDLINVSLELSKAADAIGKGDYTIPIKPRGNEDTLGNALSLMKANLIKSAEEADERNWLKTGQAELNDIMRGEQDLSTLADNVIRYLATYMKSQIGTIYLMAERDDILRMTAGYAYKEWEQIPYEYKLGDGIIGQAALEKKPKILRNIPKDYIKIDSAWIEAPPNSIIVMPFLYENKVKGVVELGSIKEFGSLELRFLEEVSEKIAIAFNASESRTKLQELLQETQQQAEELQSQQEELRQINEELEEQTRSLRE